MVNNIDSSIGINSYALRPFEVAVIGPCDCCDHPVSTFVSDLPHGAQAPVGDEQGTGGIHGYPGWRGKLGVPVHAVHRAEVFDRPRDSHDDPISTHGRDFSDSFTPRLADEKVAGRISDDALNV